MKLCDYIKPRGTAAKLARDLGIPAVLISQWANGVRPIPAERCIEIEEATHGEVPCEESREDINWAILRVQSVAR